MNKVTLQEIEMLAVLVQRAGLNFYEVEWANQILAKLRQEAQDGADAPGEVGTKAED